MNTSTKHLPGKTDRITRAIFEHASLISREQQLKELVRLNAEFARDLAQAQHCSLWLVDERKAQLWTEVARETAPIRIPLGAGAVGRCVGEDKVLLMKDALDGDVSSPHWITGFATQQMLRVPLKSLPAALCAHLDAWTAGAEQYDDITVVGLRVRG